MVHILKHNNQQGLVRDPLRPVEIPLKASAEDFVLGQLRPMSFEIKSAQSD